MMVWYPQGFVWCMSRTGFKVYIPSIAQWQVTLLEHTIRRKQIQKILEALK